MMKPKGQTEHDDGMLEFLEDIIGSNRFKEPIEILAKRVETLNELRGEKVGDRLIFIYLQHNIDIFEVLIFSFNKFIQVEPLQ